MPEYVCLKCRYIGRPKWQKRGSGKLELAGWLSFPLGLPYTIWRLYGKTPICRNCGSEMLVTIDSPTGQRLAEANERELNGEKIIPASAKLAGSMALDPEPAEAPPEIMPDEEKSIPVNQEIQSSKPRPRHQPPDTW